ncbi:MAG: hypothetical protein HY791_19380 [Deltaproteobacteria bacterium]|nr:hypothetical protein [Deltaproteobacteria bacterium]
MKPNLEERVRKAILVVLSAAIVAYLFVRFGARDHGFDRSISSDRPKHFLFAAGVPPKDRVDCADVDGVGAVAEEPYLVAVFADSSRARVRLMDAAVRDYRRVGPIAWLPVPSNLEAELDKPIDEGSLDFSDGRDPSLGAEARKLGAEQMFFHDLGRGNQVVYDLQATAPSSRVASRAVDDLRDAFALSFLSLAAPWEPRFAASSTHALARRTLRRVTDESADAFQAALRGRLSRVSDSVEAIGQSKLAMDEGRAKAILALERLLAEARAEPDELDAGVIEVELRLLRAPEYERARASIERGNELRRRLGARTSSVAPAALMGLVDAKGTDLMLGMVTLTDPSRNLPALVGWLCKSGFTNLKLSAVQFEE